MQRKDYEKALISLKPYINESIIEDTSIFSDLLYSAVSEWAIPEQELRDTFALSQGAVEKWTTGKNLPQPNIRPYILKWIYQYLENEMNAVIQVVE